MDKELWILGLLRGRSLHGYELHRIVRSHGVLYNQLKKANLYHLLERLAGEGYLTVQSESGARGARGERLIYTITTAGRARFIELLRQVIRTYEPATSGVAAAIPFLASLSQTETLALLRERRQAIVAYREQVEQAFHENPPETALIQIAADHFLSMIQAELAWIDRAQAHLQETGLGDSQTFS